MATKESDWSVEDDKETQETIGNAAASEFQRLIDRLKKEAEEAKKKDGDTKPDRLPPAA